MFPKRSSGTYCFYSVSYYSYYVTPLVDVTCCYSMFFLIIMSPNTKVRGYIVFAPFLIIIFILLLPTFSLSAPFLKNTLMDRNETWGSGKGSLGRVRRIFENFNMAAILKWRPFWIFTKNSKSTDFNEI